MFRDVSIDSQLYYWFISGDQTSTVEWEVVLKEEVDEAALKTAVADVMSIFVNFRSHPVIINGRLKISGEGERTLLEVYIESRCVLWYNGSKG